MVTIAEIKAGEIFGITALIEEFGNEGKRVSILDRDFIEISVIDAQPQGTIGFLDKQNRRCSRGLRVADEAFA